jgi:hypothetical protein
VYKRRTGFSLDRNPGVAKITASAEGIPPLDSISILLTIGRVCKDAAWLTSPRDSA